MTDQWHPGDVNLSNIILTDLNNTKHVDITNQVVGMDLYESMLSPVIKGEMYVYDPVDLLSSFPIIGEELVEIEWKTEGNEKGSNCKLIVCEVVEQQISVDNRSKSYTLRLQSPEAYYSQRQLVAKQYEQESKAIVENLVQTYLSSEKQLYADPTRGIEQVVLANMKPLQAIDLVRRRAVSTQYPSSSFCFYENTRGYHFLTVEAMFQRGQKTVGNKVFHYDTNTQEDISTAQYRNIIALKHISTGSTLDTVTNGGLRNQVISYDMVTGDLQDHNYANEDFQKVDENGKPLHTDGFVSKFGDTASQSYLLPVDSSLPEHELPTKTAHLQGFVAKITSNLLHIHIQGDSSVTVGDVITVELPDASGLDQSGESKLLAGNYLVAKCRHIFQVGKLRNYTQSLELIKGSYITQV